MTCISWIYWVNYVTLTFETHDLDEFFNVKFLNNWISDSGIAGLIDLKQKWNEPGKWINYILGWLHDLALWPHSWPWPLSFKVEVWNIHISGMGGRIDIVGKGCELSIHYHNIDLWVTRWLQKLAWVNMSSWMCLTSPLLWLTVSKTVGIYWWQHFS